MGDDLTTANVNRSYSLAATCLAIFMYMLFLDPSLILVSIGLGAVACAWSQPLSPLHWDSCRLRKALFVP